MKKLILHIGLHKTGSTAVQETLHKNRGIGLKHGLHYPAFTANFSRALCGIFGPDQHKLLVNQLSGHDTPEKFARARKATSKRLLNDLSTIAEPTTLISGEDATALPLLDVGALSRFFHSMFDEVKILAYVRPPRAHINSIIQQKIRKGERLGKLLKDPPAPLYRARLEPYYNVFGAENITVKAFAPKTLHRQCIVADVLNQMGFDDELYDKLTVDRKNDTLSWPATFYLNAINKDLPIYVDGKPNRKRERHLISNARKITGEKFALPYSYLNQGCSEYTDDIAWVEEKLGVKLSPLDIQPGEADDRPLAHFIAEKREEAFISLSRYLHDLNLQPATK